MVTPHSYVSTLDSEAQRLFFFKTKTQSQLSINIDIFMLYIHKWISLISSHSETQAALAALEVKCDSSGLKGRVSRDRSIFNIIPLLCICLISVTAEEASCWLWATQVNELQTDRRDYPQMSETGQDGWIMCHVVLCAFSRRKENMSLVQITFRVWAEGHL